MDPEITIIIVLLIISTLSLILRCTNPKAGAIPALLGMITGGGVCVLSSRLLESMDAYFVLFVCVIGFSCMALSGSLLIKGATE